VRAASDAFGIVAAMEEASGGLPGSPLCAPGRSESTLALFSGFTGPSQLLRCPTLNNVFRTGNKLE
jgi:hypothetical protein